MEQQDLVIGNLFYFQDLVFYALFFDIDGEHDRFQMAKEMGMRFLNSRHHRQGHAVKYEGCEEGKFLEDSAKLNHPAFWPFQCIKFLRLTPDLTRWVEDRGFIPVVTKNIHPQLKYQPSQYEIRLPKTITQKRQLVSLEAMARIMGLAQKISGVILKVLVQGGI